MLGPTRTPPTYEQVNQLTYIGQILKESLRLWPTAPAFALPYQDTTIGGQVPDAEARPLIVLIADAASRPAVWGDDAEVFDPDNFAPEAERALPANAYKPFGNGQRACIGRQFAMHEATLVLGMILQRFQLVDHTRYQLEDQGDAHIKPDGLPSCGCGGGPSRRGPARRHRQARGRRNGRAEEAAASHGTPLRCCSAPTLGTAEELARRSPRGEAAASP